MNRREALQSLLGTAALAPAYVSAEDAAGVEVVVLTASGPISEETRARLIATFEHGMKGTVLEGVRVLVLASGLEMKLVRKGTTT